MNRSNANLLSSGQSRLSGLAEDPHETYRKWGYDLQMREAVNDHVLEDRVMYGWRPQHIATTKDLVGSYKQASESILVTAVLTNVNVQERFEFKLGKREILLLSFCLFLTVAFAAILLSLIIKKSTPSGNLLGGFALAIILYEAWILCRRVVRGKTTNK